MYYYFIYFVISNKQANKQTNERANNKTNNHYPIAGIDHQKSNAIQEKGYTHFML